MYPSPKILRNISYYHLHRKVIEELKSKPVKEIKWFNIVLIELKEKQNSIMYKYGKRLDYPTYKGEMYTYKYVLKGHKNVRWFFNNQYKKCVNIFPYNFSDIYTENITDPIISYIVKDCIEEIYNWNDNDYSEKTINEVKQILRQKIEKSNETYEERAFKLLNKTYDETDMRYISVFLVENLIKIRVKIGSMNLTKTEMDFYSPLNLKYWSKTTLKPSNKGLIADTTYSWTEHWRRGGWKFGGITAEDLENLCIENGFKKEKKKKYQYGDYANWFLHNLE